MMREISKKDAELAQAYIKLEEQAKLLAEGSEAALATIQDQQDTTLTIT